MKEFLLVSGDFVKTGGMDRANLALAEYLAKNGYSVHLVSYRVDSGLLNYDNVIFHRAWKPLNSYLLGEFFLDHLGRKVAKNIIKSGGRVVVNGSSCSFNDINWVHYVHAASKAYPPLNYFFKLKGYLAHMIALRREKDIIPQAKLVFVVCKAMKDDLIRFLRIPEDKIKIVYLGINERLFKPISVNVRQETRRAYGLSVGRPVIIFIGGLGNRRKGFDILFSAWEMLCKESEWDVDLAVVGRGSELGYWKRTAKKRGLEQRIKFLGFISQGLPHLLASCDLLVLPTRHEGSSVVAKEAFCCGIPALVTRASGIVERYPGEIKELILHNPDDISELVQRLKSWRKRIDYYREAIIPFSEKLRSWSWDDMAKQMTDIIENESKSF